MIFGHDISFWISVAGATVIKVLTSPYYSLMRAVMTVFAAIFAAYTFTDPAVHWLGLDPKTYTTPMAALLALTGEGLMRAIIAGGNDPWDVLARWKKWRSGQ